jgi:acyl transferase domain-containing protein/3-hydroxymyristoyl/3-hydroxydecanoyl-(acyl carrier protein) dehydratase
MQDIAIVGMGCLFPGNTDRRTFWDRILRGETLTQEDRYLERTIERGGVTAIAPPPTRYGADARELAAVGEVYKWTLAVCGEALDESGYLGTADRLSRCGLVMGTLAMPVREDVDLLNGFLRRDMEVILRTLTGVPALALDIPLRHPGLTPAAAFADSQPPHFAAKRLGLGGPVVSFNAACATPLYAIKLASLYLSAGAADMMVVGSHCYNEFVIGNCGLFDILGVLCDTGASRPLDRGSRGLVAGSGAGAFVLKPLAAAERDGDAILAVIESVGWSNDAGSRALLAPSPEGQARAYQDAYRGGVSPRVDYVECHATGTRAGDQTELESLAAFFAARGIQPRYGALKGNTGHFFTASANAALAKVILALQAGVIPPTIRVDDPVASRDGSFSAANLVREPTPWPPGAEPRRAAVNAFGFGGVNAHLVLREHRPRAVRAALPAAAARPEPLAIVGMGIHLGALDSVKAYWSALVKGKPARSEPGSRWRGLERRRELLDACELAPLPPGAYLESFDFDFFRYKLAANEDEYFIRRDLLLLSVAAQALDDAGVQPGQAPRTAVIINCSQDFSDFHFMGSEEVRTEMLASLEAHATHLSASAREDIWRAVRSVERTREHVGSVPGIIPNIRANRISAHWKLEGPSFIVMERESSFVRSLELARLLLEQDGMDRVVIGAVELCGEIEHLYIQGQLGRSAVLRDKGVGEGAVVLVVTKAADAARRGDRVYACVDAACVASPGTGDAGDDAARRCAHALWQQAPWRDAELGALDLPLAMYPAASEQLARAIAGEHGAVSATSPPRARSVEDVIGCSFSLHGGAAIVKRALELYMCVQCPEDGELPRPWTTLADRRCAVVGTVTAQGECGLVGLSLAARTEAIGGDRVDHMSTWLVPVSGRDRDELVAELSRARAAFAGSGDAAGFAHRQHDRLTEPGRTGRRTAVLIAGSRRAMLDEIAQAAQAVPRALADGKPWTSPAGSYFTPAPLGPDVKIAWMSPPGRMLNPLAMCDLVSHFPRLARIQEDEVRRLARGDRAAFHAFESRWASSGAIDYLMEYSLCKATASVLTQLGLRPAALVGASLGELVLTYALDGFDLPVAQAGQPEHSLLEKLERYMTLLQDPTWHASRPGDAASPWESHYLKADRRHVEELVAGEDRVFVTIVGSPRDVIIAGSADACRRVIRQLDGASALLAENSVVHTPLAAPIEPHIFEMERAAPLALRAGLGFQVYSSAEGRPVAPGAASTARHIADIITRPVDFCGVVRNAHADGVRVFINVGTNDVCARWASESLGAADALVVSCLGAPRPVEHGLKAMCAQLLSHGIAVSARGLLPRPESLAVQLTRRVRTGLPSYDESYHRAAAPELDTTSAPEAPRAAPGASWPQRPASAPAPQPRTPQPAAPLPPVPAPPVRPRPHAAVQVTGGAAIAGFAHAIEPYRRSAAAFALYQASEESLLRLALRPRGLARSRARPGRTPALWDQDQILEMTTGRLSKVLGPSYAAVDDYPVRARLPSPPFLFVTRVTRIDAELGQLRPSSIEMEYDIAADCLFAQGDTVSSVAFTESAQIGILLMGYLGIDVISSGRLRYRVADTTTTFLDDLPPPGATVRGVFRNTSFSKHGDTTLAHSDYECFHGDRLFLRMAALGGFFTKQDVASSRGLSRRTPVAARQAPPAGLPFLVPARSAFGKRELEAFYAGDYASCFGSPAYRAPARPVPRPLPAVQMLDRVEKVALVGGDFGLGEIVAEKDLAVDHWAFDAHFKNDPVFPGSLVIEGINQLVTFAMFHLGVVERYRDCILTSLRGVKTRTSFRGQIERVPSRLRYTVHIRELRADDELLLVADVDVEWQGKIVMRSENYTVAAYRAATRELAS